MDLRLPKSRLDPVRPLRWSLRPSQPASTVLDLLIVLALILLNGFFSMSEMAVVTSRKSRLRQMGERHRGARMAHDLAERPERFLSTVQIGITLVGVLTGAIGGVALAEHLTGPLRGIAAIADYAATIAMIVSVTGITFLTLILGELVPKRLALLDPERVASLAAPPMAVLAAIARPFVTLLAFSTRLVLRLFGMRERARQTITEEEIRLLVHEGAEQGVIDSHERNMVNRVLRLGDRTVDSLMTPRTEIIWLDVEADTGENLAVMRDSPHSRFPVQRGSDREVLGILEVKTLFDSLRGNATDLFKRLRTPLYLPDTTPALRALEHFREEDVPMALVVDEYGDIQGLVTVNDILTAVVGTPSSAPGTADDEGAPIVRRDDGSWLIDGRLPVDDLRELLGVGGLPEEEQHDYHSAAGMLIAQFGRIPTVGESFQWRQWRFEVVDLDGARIDKILVEPAAAPGSD